jgi:hypothetical protein
MQEMAGKCTEHKSLCKEQAAKTPQKIGLT